MNTHMYDDYKENYEYFLFEIVVDRHSILCGFIGDMDDFIFQYVKMFSGKGIHTDVTISEPTEEAVEEAIRQVLADSLDGEVEVFVRGFVDADDAQKYVKMLKDKVAHYGEEMKPSSVNILNNAINPRILDRVFNSTKKLVG